MQIAAAARMIYKWSCAANVLLQFPQTFVAATSSAGLLLNSKSSTPGTSQPLSLLSCPPLVAGVSKMYLHVHADV